jgi:hypothetical protein
MYSGIRTLVVMAALVLATISSASAATINVQAVIDHDSELVLTDSGFYWRNLASGVARPGAHGASYELDGPTFVNGAAWNPTWNTVGTRTISTSSMLSIDLSEYLGWSLSSAYGGYFDSYSNSRFDLNRGIVSASSFNGFQTIRFQDYASGECIYSIDIRVADPAGPSAVPEPGTMMLLGSGLVGLVGLGRKKIRK